MAAASDMPDENIPACIPKNVITRSLGPHPMVNVDLEGPYDVCAGDKFLLCSDGLTGVVDNDLIAGLLECLSPQDAAATLVDVANLRGGPDNISVVVAEVAGGKPAPCADNGQANGCPMGDSATSWMERLFGWMFGSGGTKASSHELGGPYGNGPYRQYASHLATTAVDMAGLCRELATLESEARSPLAGRKNIDWAAFHQRCEQAEAANQQKQLGEAIAAYAKAIRQLMSEVRTDGGPGDSDVLR